MTVEQENAIKIVQDLINEHVITGEQATTLIIGIIKDDTPGQPLLLPNINPGIPNPGTPSPDPEYKPMKIYYEHTTGVDKTPTITTEPNFTTSVMF